MKRGTKGGVEYTVRKKTASVGRLHRTFVHDEGMDGTGGNFHTIEIMDGEDPAQRSGPGKDVEWMGIAIGRLEKNQQGGWTFEEADGPLTPRGVEVLEGDYKDLEAFIRRCIPDFAW